MERVGEVDARTGLGRSAHSAANTAAAYDHDNNTATTKCTQKKKRNEKVKQAQAKMNEVK